MLVSATNTAGPLTDAEVRAAVDKALAQADLEGKRVLVVIPDGTRTAPVPLFFRLFHEILEQRVAKLDYLVALGTHPPMDDAALGRLVGVPVSDGQTGPSHILNHRWDLPESFVTFGVLPATEVEALSEGHLSLEAEIRLNRLLGGPEGPSEYDHLLKRL